MFLQSEAKKSFSTGLSISNAALVIFKLFLEGERYILRFHDLLSHSPELRFSARSGPSFVIQSVLLGLGCLGWQMMDLGEWENGVRDLREGISWKHRILQFQFQPSSTHFAGQSIYTTLECPRQQYSPPRSLAASSPRFGLMLALAIKLVDSRPSSPIRVRAWKKKKGCFQTPEISCVCYRASLFSFKTLKVHSVCLADELKSSKNTHNANFLKNMAKTSFWMLLSLFGRWPPYFIFSIYFLHCEELSFCFGDNANH